MTDDGRLLMAGLEVEMLDDALLRVELAWARFKAAEAARGEHSARGHAFLEFRAARAEFMAAMESLKLRADVDGPRTGR